MVGWLKRILGDEYELHGAVTIVRTSEWRNDGLDRLCEGPQNSYDITKPATLPEELHRLTVRRVKVASESGWAEKCPKPNSYDAKAEAAAERLDWE